MNVRQFIKSFHQFNKDSSHLVSYLEFSLRFRRHLHVICSVTAGLRVVKNSAKDGG